MYVKVKSITELNVGDEVRADVWLPGLKTPVETNAKVIRVFKVSQKVVIEYVIERRWHVTVSFRSIVARKVS